MRITEKRAALLREWLLAINGNDESYYNNTLFNGLPDGDEINDVLYDLKTGFYDDDIDDMLEMYAFYRRIYRASGWYVNGAIYNIETEAIEAIESALGYKLPVKIYKSN